MSLKALRSSSIISSTQNSLQTNGNVSSGAAPASVSSAPEAVKLTYGSVSSLSPVYKSMGRTFFGSNSSSTSSSNCNNEVGIDSAPSIRECDYIFDNFNELFNVRFVPISLADAAAVAANSGNQSVAKSLLFLFESIAIQQAKKNKLQQSTSSLALSKSTAGHSGEHTTPQQNIRISSPPPYSSTSLSSQTQLSAVQQQPPPPPSDPLTQASRPSRSLRYVDPLSAASKDQLITASNSQFEDNSQNIKMNNNGSAGTLGVKQSNKTIIENASLQSQQESQESQLNPITISSQQIIVKTTKTVNGTQKAGMKKRRNISIVVTPAAPSLAATAAAAAAQTAIPSVNIHQLSQPESNILYDNYYPSQNSEVSGCATNISSMNVTATSSISINGSVMSQFAQGQQNQPAHYNNHHHRSKSNLSFSSINPAGGAATSTQAGSAIQSQFKQVNSSMISPVVQISSKLNGGGVKSGSHFQKRKVVKASCGKAAGFLTNATSVSVSAGDGASVTAMNTSAAVMKSVESEQSSGVMNNMFLHPSPSPQLLLDPLLHIGSSTIALGQYFQQPLNTNSMLYDVTKIQMSSNNSHISNNSKQSLIYGPASCKESSNQMLLTKQSFHSAVVGVPATTRVQTSNMQNKENAMNLGLAGVDGLKAVAPGQSNNIFQKNLLLKTSTTNQQSNNGVSKSQGMFAAAAANAKGNEGSQVLTNLSSGNFATTKTGSFSRNHSIMQQSAVGFGSQNYSNSNLDSSSQQQTSKIIRHPSKPRNSSRERSINQQSRGFKQQQLQVKDVVSNASAVASASTATSGPSQAKQAKFNIRPIVGSVHLTTTNAATNGNAAVIR